MLALGDSKGHLLPSSQTRTLKCEHASQHGHSCLLILQTNTHTDAHTETHTHARTQTCMHTQTFTHIHTDIYTHRNTYMYAHTWVNTQIERHTQIDIHKHTQGTRTDRHGVGHTETHTETYR